MADQREWLTIEQARAHVRVSRRTIYNWLKDGKIQYVRTAGGSIRIDAESLWRRDPPPPNLSPP
jgi:excisionase family DNA binding protein